jgi:hypothetical protein
MKRWWVTLAATITNSVVVAVPPDLTSETARRTALIFVGQISNFQGYFDSVVEFCRPRLPELTIKHATSDWKAQNQEALDYRDSELTRVLMTVRQLGMSQAGLDEIAGWPDKHYRESLKKAIMVNDIRYDKNPMLACARRLGDLNSDRMSLQRLSPGAWAYLQELKAK